MDDRIEVVDVVDDKRGAETQRAFEALKERRVEEGCNRNLSLLCEASAPLPKLDMRAYLVFVE
jgi:hypothetical protein